MKRSVIIVLCLVTAALQAQPSERFVSGQRQFRLSDFSGARISFTALVEDPTASALHPQALFWLARTEMALRSWDRASAAIEAFLGQFPHHPLFHEAIYEKGRLLFYMEDYENSLITLNDFLKTEPNPELTSNALFWMGEGSLALGRFDEAQVLFRRVIENFPASFKVEASRYRLSMIELKLREEELLRLLKWSHEEILNALDEFRRRERAYQQAIQAYQRRILDLEAEDDQSERIRSLEAEIRELRSQRAPRAPSANLTPQATPDTPQAPVDNTQTQSSLRRLREMRAQAEELKIFYDDWEARNVQGR